MIINQVTKEETERLEKKFKAFDILLAANKPVFGYLKKDPTLFAYHFFRDDKDQRFKMLPWQDKFLNDKSSKKLMCIARQSGKTTTVCIDALHYTMFNENSTVLVISKTKDQAKELIYRMRNFMRKSSIRGWEYLSPQNKENKSEIMIKNIANVETKTYSRIIVVPATDAARGYTPQKIICDEAAFWENGEYIFNQVIEPSVLWSKGSISILSTPNGKQGIFWKLFNLQDAWSVYQFDYRVNPYITQEEIEKIKASKTLQEYLIEYEAKFVASASAYFNYNDIQAAVDETAGTGNLPASNMLCIGVDFGKINDSCVIEIGYVENPNEEPHRHIIKVCRRIVKPLGTNYASILQELRELYKIYRPRLMVMDATGVGEAPSDILRAEAYLVEPVKFSVQSKANIYSNLKIHFEQRIEGKPRIKIPNAKDLIDQLELFEYEYTEKNILLHAPEGYHDDECFIGDTFVHTNFGKIPIKKLKIGDMVLTRNGYKPIININKREAKVIFRFGIVGTPEHPFITSHGIEKFMNLDVSHITYIWNDKQSCIMEGHIIDIPIQNGDNLEFITGVILNGNPHQKPYIDRFGKIIMEVSQKTFLSITKMGIPLTTPWEISKLLKEDNILNYIQIRQNIKNIVKKQSNLLKQKQQNGIVLKKEENGIGNIGKKVLEKSTTVYNLKIADCPEFFANNILVHNCDALALMVWGLTRINRPPTTVAII